MKSVSLILASLVFVFAFSACSTCAKSKKMSSGCCAADGKSSCPPGSAHCKVKAS